MSMITEQVEELREEADFIIETLDMQYPTTIGVAKIMKRAADTIEQLLAKVRKENGFIIPDNATNGEILCSIFPDMHYTLSEKTPRVVTTIGVASSFDIDWWNAPYKRGDTE